MSRELVLCILVAAYDEIQTAQFNDVAQFGNIESFSKTHFGKRGKSSLEKLRACYYPYEQSESGAYGIRTRDLLNAIEALYQLS